MGFLDRFLGRDDQPSDQPPAQPSGRYGDRPTSDEAAVERYRYLLRTAPPDAIEQAHAEAFAQLTPEQRRQVLDGLAHDVPEAERAQSDDPRALARMATRAEMRAPGTLENRFGGGGVGMGGMLAGSLLASVAGAFVGTAIADSFFDLSDGGGTDPAADGGGDVAADAGGDTGFDGGFGGDFGGDFGGGDF
ncbi:hypothetical protein [Cellulomonas sp. Leaf334]|uniref:hypothetical protein n=1 Tax=Cellulomonas sp. Leaf334 TaxID=1736339 RepID=UPI0007011FBF|nr:hypothetical protein [Cellulomonas sp. Leaf334]KQR07285.1 hypothetical protein ASF78_21525 [Cellulomonas sp. Leaf334]